MLSRRSTTFLHAWLAALTCLTVATGCSALGATVATTAPSGPPTPSPTPELTFVPSIPPTPTPRPRARIEVVNSFVRAWQDRVTNAIEYQVVVVVKNVGPVAADFGTSNRTYRVLDANGVVVDEGAFTYAFPPVIKPGESAFFIDADTLREGVAPEAATSVEAEINGIAAHDPVPTYEANAVSVAAAEVGEGVVASGTLTNPTTRDAVAVVVGVVLYGPNDVILGGLLDNFSVQGLAAGTSLSFTTQDLRTPPLAADAVARVDLVAYDAAF